MKIVFVFLAFFITSCAKPTPPAAKSASNPSPSLMQNDPQNTAISTPAPPTKELALNPQSPLEVIKSYTEELKAVVEVDKQKPAGKNLKREQTISKKVRNFFDFHELSKQSLGKHWDKTPQAKRDEFSTLFTKLVESSYLKRSRTLMGDYLIDYKNEETKGTHAKVTSIITRKDANLDITYELIKKNNKWMIYNIVLDDVDLIRNYQSQFNRIIQKDGFNQLLSMLRKKVNSKDNDVIL